MATCIYKHSLAASADDTWALISQFGEPDWLPGPERVEALGEGVGMARLLHVPGLDAPVEETLETLDEANRQLSYRVKKNPFVPYDNYHATVAVRPAAPGCELVFESTFALDAATLAAAPSAEAAEDAAQQALSGFYQMMAEALGRALSGP